MKSFPKEQGCLQGQRRIRISVMKTSRACIPKWASCLLAFLLALVCDAPAAVQQAWVARYNAGTNVGTEPKIALDAQGNIVVAGHGTSTNGDYDYLILKYSPTGAQQWAARFDSAPGTNDQVRALAVDGNGNVYVTGTTKTLKYDGNGAVQWEAPYGARALALDPNGDVCITGFSSTTFATAKIDKDAGTNLWLRTFSYMNRAGYPDISQAIAVDARSNIYVGGSVFCHIGRPIEKLHQPNGCRL